MTEEKQQDGQPGADEVPPEAMEELTGNRDEGGEPDDKRPR